MTHDDLYNAVARLMEERAYQQEAAFQERNFSENERIAFRRGFFRGLQTDILRDDPSAWDRAAAKLKGE